MTLPTWPALDRLIGTLRTAPARTGSVISTIYGDAILPRGGALDLSDLLILMARLGASEGVVRTAISRLARDGVLQGRRTGRRSAYALTRAGRSGVSRRHAQDLRSAYPALERALYLAFPVDAPQRVLLETDGFQPLAPGALVALHPSTAGPLSVEASGPASALPALAQRAWPICKLNDLYQIFLEAIDGLHPPAEITPLDAIAARTVLIHAWRRIALRDPRLPDGLLPRNWTGNAARQRCICLYQALAPASERWLDCASAAGQAHSREGLIPVRAGTSPSVPAIHHRGAGFVASASRKPIPAAISTAVIGRSSTFSASRSPYSSTWSSTCDE